MTTTIWEEILEHGSQFQSFRFTPFLVSTYGHKLVAPPKPPAACRAFLYGNCPLGSSCPEPHTAEPSVATMPEALSRSHNQQSGHGSFNSLVCKHWLRGLCKKGEACEFLHEYNLRKMPECNFFVRNGYCSNGDECLYLHIDPLSKLPPCPHYERGFCPLGPRCAKKHVRRHLCPYYLAGFCPDGRICKVGIHPKWRSDEELGDPVAKNDTASTVATAASGITSSREGEDHIGEQFDQNDQSEKDGEGGHRDRPYGRDRQRDGDHTGQRKWRGGRGGRGNKSNRRYRDRH